MDQVKSTYVIPTSYECDRKQFNSQQLERRDDSDSQNKEINNNVNRNNFKKDINFQDQPNEQNSLKKKTGRSLDQLRNALLNNIDNNQSDMEIKSRNNEDSNKVDLNSSLDQGIILNGLEPDELKDQASIVSSKRSILKKPFYNIHLQSQFNNKQSKNLNDNSKSSLSNSLTHNCSFQFQNTPQNSGSSIAMQLCNPLHSKAIPLSFNNNSLKDLPQIPTNLSPVNKMKNLEMSRKNSTQSNKFSSQKGQQLQSLNNLNNNFRGVLQNHSSSVNTVIEVPEIFNQMTLQDLNILRKQAESLKAKNQEIFSSIEKQSGDDSHSRLQNYPNRQKGLTSIKREMLTYYEKKDNIVNSWEKKQIEQKQKNRREIKSIVENHFKKQQIALERAQQNGEESEEEEHIFLKQESLKDDKKLLIETRSSFNPKRQNSKEQKRKNNLSYSQLKNKNMQLIQHAKSRAAKSRENSEISYKLNQTTPNSQIQIASQSNDDSQLISRLNHSSSPSKFNLLLQSKEEILNSEREEQQNDEDSNQDIALSKKSDNEDDGEDHQQEVKVKESQQSQSPIKFNHLSIQLLAKAFIKQKRKSMMKLLEEKKLQKDKVKATLNEVLTRNNRLHSSEADQIMLKIQQCRENRENNEVEVNFKQMTNELSKREREFCSMMESNSEDMVKKRKREDILFYTQQKIYSNKKFDPTRFFREELLWKNTIEEVCDFTQGREDQLEKAKYDLHHRKDLEQSNNNVASSQRNSIKKLRISS